MSQTAYELCSWLLNGSYNHKDGSIFRAVIFPFLVAALTISVWHIWTQSKSSKKLIAPLPSGPRGLPIVGYIPFLGTDLHRLFMELAEVYGPIYKLWLGNKLCVVISSPTLVKEVVRDFDITCSERDPPIAAQIATYGGNNIAFDSYSSPSWKNKRKVLATEMLTSGNLNAFYGLRREQVMKSIGDVYKNVGQPIDVGELSFLTAINSVISMVLGGKLRGDKGAGIEGHFKDVSADLMMFLGKTNISDIFPVLAPLDLQGVAKRMKRVNHLFNQLLDSVIELRMKMATEKVNVGAKSEEKLDFLRLLLEHVGQDSATSITMNQLKGLLMED